MTKIRMNKEMSLSIEWIPKTAYMHSSLDQSNYSLIKQEAELFENTLNTHSVRLQVSSKETDKEAKQQIALAEQPVIPHETDVLTKSPKELIQVTKRLCNRGWIDVKQMTAEPTSDYKYLFIYEDQWSKFVVLKALHSDTAKEVATKLLDIFAIIGVPQILSSGNGFTFSEQIIHELRLLWNGILTLRGDASKHKVNCRDFKSLLECWTRENPTKTWYEGLNFVQIFHNTMYQCQNNQVPCDILFGREGMRGNFPNLGIVKKDEEILWQEGCAEESWIGRLSNRKDGNATDSPNNANSHCQENGDTEIAQNENEPSRSNNSGDFNFVDVTNEICAKNTQTDSSKTDAKKKAGDNGDTRSLKCKYCQKQYMKLGHLKNHMRTHKAGRVLKCKVCSKTFSVLRLYEKHLKQSHGQDKSKEKGDRAVRRNTRSNNVAATDDEEKMGIEVSRRTDVVDLRKDEERWRGIRDEDLNDRIATTVKRKSSAENRPSKTQCALQCTYCAQKFSFPSVLERHMRSHTNERPYVCNVCNKSFKQLGHLSQHSLTHHDYRSFQCTVCCVKFNSLDSLKQHMHSHRGHDATAHKMRDVYRLFECDSCKKVFTTKSVLERHIFTHTQERQYDCKVCGKRFKQAGHVKSHMLVHTGERRFQCTVCSKRFSLSNSLKKHMYVHNGEKPYQCDVCGARFLEKRNLNGHLLTHTNERPYCCKICGKRYTLADTLRRHVSAAHEDGRTYQCEICAKMFKQLAHLSVHKKVHNDERPFQCHLCEKNFKHKNVLKSHLAIHANVRPFECDVCKATFVRKTNLQTHISSAHMNERPYTCTICGKRFKQISHLNGHVVVHSNLMPYKCDYCDRRCNRLDNLKKHMRLHTKNKE